MYLQRLTVKNPGEADNYRLPVRENGTMYMIEAEKACVSKQEGKFMSAYFGLAVDRLGAYEELGSVEEIKDKLARLDKLEGS